jgi:hypothetical protein
MKITLLNFQNNQNLLDLELLVLPRNNEFIEHKHTMYKVEKIIHTEREIQVYVSKPNNETNDFEITVDND